VAAITIPENVRTATDPEKDAELLASVQVHGIIEPLIVQGSPILNGLQLVAGFRRLRAAKAAGLEAVPCRVMGIDHQKVHEFRLIENLQREDLNPIDEARAYRDYLQSYPEVTQEDLGRRLGKSQPYIANRLRLLALPEAGQELITRGILSASAAQEILKVKHLPNAVEKTQDLIDSHIANGDDITVERVKSLVGEAVEGVTKDLRHGLEFDGATECKDCENKVEGRWGGLRCTDPACWKTKNAAAKEAKKAAAVEKVLAGKPIDWTEDNRLTEAFDDCPASCEHRKKARVGSAAGESRAFCLDRDSDCYRERRKANKAASSQESQDLEWKTRRERQERARAVWDSREKERLERAESYLSARTSGGSVSDAELRLICAYTSRFALAPEQADELSRADLPTLIGQTVKHLLTAETNWTWDNADGRYLPRDTAYEDIKNQVIGWTPPAEETAHTPDPSEGGAYRVDDDGQAVDPVEDAQGEAAAEASDEEMGEGLDCGGVCEECSETRCGCHPRHEAADAGPAEPPADDPDEEPEPAACHYLRKIVDARECRSCNDDLRMTGQCCDYVLKGEAPHKCPDCDEFSGCQKGQQAYPDEAEALEAAG